MYSKEFKQYDLDMINKKSDILYQLESPDYFSYGTEKRDTPLSLFKKVFYAIYHLRLFVYLRQYLPLGFILTKEFEWSPCRKKNFFLYIKYQFF